MSDETSAIPSNSDLDSVSVERPRPGKWRRRLRLAAYIILGVIAAAALASMVALRANVENTDYAAVNVGTLICTFAIFCCCLTWFVCLSGFPGIVRWTTVLSMLGLIVLLVAILRVERVTGELVPTFRLRWLPKHDQLLEKPAPAAEVTADLAKATADDFPQFLGPERRAVVTTPIRLARDWDAQPPRLLWRQPIGAGWSAFSAVNGFAVTLEQRDSEELVTCYAIPTGKLVWAHAVEARHSSVLGGVGPRSTPTIHEGKVYALGATGILRCLDGADGTEIWRDDLLARYGISPEQEAATVSWGRAGSPLIVDNLVVVPAGGPPGGPFYALVALDKNRGELIWQGGDKQISYASPALATLAGVRQIVSVNENNVSGHDPQTGQQLWQHPWPGSSSANASASQAVAIGGDQLLLTKGYGEGAKLLELRDSDSGTLEVDPVWVNKAVLRTKFTNVAVIDHYAYGLSDGILECIDLATGERKWKRGRYRQGQVLGVGDLLLVQAESGDVVMVEATPEQHRELGSFPALSGQTWNNLCLFGHFLLVRNAQEAACYELAPDEVQGRRDP